MNNKLQRCNASGSGFMTTDDCNSLGCTGTQCRVCMPNSKDCSGTTFKQCNGDGTGFSTNKNCPLGCTNAGCNVCSGSETRCKDSKTVETCTNGQFKATSCPGGGNCFPNGPVGSSQAGCGCKIDPCHCEGEFVVTHCDKDTGDAFQFFCNPDNPCVGDRCAGGQKESVCP